MADRDEYKECSGDPKCCPENEGYGCCNTSPQPAPHAMPDAGNALLQKLLDSFEIYNGEIVFDYQAMYEVRDALLTQPAAVEPAKPICKSIDNGYGHPMIATLTGSLPPIGTLLYADPSPAVAEPADTEKKVPHRMVAMLEELCNESENGTVPSVSIRDVIYSFNQSFDEPDRKAIDAQGDMTPHPACCWPWPPAATLGKDGERAAFEAFCKSEGLDYTRFENRTDEMNGHYWYQEVYTGWKAWQARALLAQQPAASDVREGFWDVYEIGKKNKIYATVFNSEEAAHYASIGHRVVEQSTPAVQADEGG